jgi:hypothetical protein
MLEWIVIILHVLFSAATFVFLIFVHFTVKKNNDNINKNLSLLNNKLINLVHTLNIVNKSEFVLDVAQQAQIDSLKH